MAEAIAKVSPSGRPTGNPDDVVRVADADKPEATALDSGKPSDNDRKAALRPALAVPGGTPLEESTAPQKTVILDNVTVHRPMKGHVPITYDIMRGGQVGGKYVVGAFPPGTAVTLDADEADKLMALFGGREVPHDQAAEDKDIKLV